MCYNHYSLYPSQKINGIGTWGNGRDNGTSPSRTGAAADIAARSEIHKQRMADCSLYEQREEALKKLLEEVRLLLRHIQEWAQRWIYHAASMAVREREREEEGEDLYGAEWTALG
jgi:hypothetical protein